MNCPDCKDHFYDDSPQVNAEFDYEWTVRRGNGKKEKDSERSGGSNKSNSKERTVVRMRTV